MLLGFTVKCVFTRANIDWDSRKGEFVASKNVLSIGNPFPECQSKFYQHTVVNQESRVDVELIQFEVLSSGMCTCHPIISPRCAFLLSHEFKRTSDSASKQLFWIRSNILHCNCCPAGRPHTTIWWNPNIFSWVESNFFFFNNIGTTSMVILLKGCSTKMVIFEN